MEASLIKKEIQTEKYMYISSFRTPEINPWDNMGILGLTSKVTCCY